MNLHHPIFFAIPFIIAAEAGAGSDSVGLTIANYAVATGMLGYFIRKEGQDRQERKDERAEAQKKHDENIRALQEVRDAMKETINLVIVAMGGIKNMDVNFTALAEQLKTNGDSHHRK